MVSNFPRIPYYKVVGEIGSGSFARVYKAVHHETNNVYAIKVIEIGMIGPGARANLMNEIKILTGLNHPNIVRLIETQQVEDSTTINLVMEYCDGGTLMQYLKKHKPLKFEVARRFVRDLSLGMKELYKAGVAHRDIKPQNILLNAEEGESTPKLKIADFGFAKLLGEENMTATVCGTPAYMAPELLRKEKYSPSVDLWSLGLLFYEILSGKFPFDMRSTEVLAKSIQSTYDNLKYPIDLPREYSELVNGMLQPDPDNRMSFEEFFAHRVFNSTSPMDNATPRREEMSIDPFKDISEEELENQKTEEVGTHNYYSVETPEDRDSQSGQSSLLTAELESFQSGFEKLKLPVMQPQNVGKRYNEDKTSLRVIEESYAFSFSVLELAFLYRAQGDYLAACSLISLSLDELTKSLKLSDNIKRNSDSEEENTKFERLVTSQKRCYELALRRMEIDFNRIKKDDAFGRSINITKLIMENVLVLGRKGVEKDGSNAKEASQLYYKAVILLNYLLDSNSLSESDRSTFYSYLHGFARRLASLKQTR